MGDAAERRETLPGLLAGRPAETPAIIDASVATSYGALDEASRRVAAGLAELGVGTGDRVAIWLPNVVAWLVLCLACARLGAVVVCVNTRFRSREVADLLARSRAQVLVLWPEFKDIDFVGILEAIEPAALADLETLIVYGEGEAPAGDIADRLAALGGTGRRLLDYTELEARPPRHEDQSAPDAAGAIFTTSGTTKAPKLVIHSQHSIAAHARRVARNCGFEAPDCIALAALPFCGVFGFSLAFAALAAGRPMVSMRLFEPVEAGRLIREYAVTHAYGSDDLFHQLLAAAPEAKPFPSLRLGGFAAFNAALDSVVAEGDRCGLALTGVYGSSELQALITCQRIDAPAEERAQGGGYPTAEDTWLRARDPESGVLVGPGEAGELEAKSVGLFQGYDGDPEATRAAFTEDGYFRTGDLGRVMADGRVVFLSRIGDVLRLGGFLTNPAEIEAHVEAHASVRECKAVAVATEAGNRAVAFVIPEDNARLDEEALRRHCLEGIAKYKMPIRFFAIDAFPVVVSPNGLKVQRPVLRDIAEARLAADSE